MYLSGYVVTIEFEVFAHMPSTTMSSTTTSTSHQLHPPNTLHQPSSVGVMEFGSSSRPWWDFAHESMERLNHLFWVMCGVLQHALLWCKEGLVSVSGNVFDGSERASQWLDHNVFVNTDSVTDIIAAPFILLMDNIGVVVLGLGAMLGIYFAFIQCRDCYRGEGEEEKEAHPPQPQKQKTKKHKKHKKKKTIGELERRARQTASRRVGKSMRIDHPCFSRQLRGHRYAITDAAVSFDGNVRCRMDHMTNTSSTSPTHQPHDQHIIHITNTSST